MVSELVARNLLSRLKGLSFAPRAGEGAEEAIAALQTADSETIATRAVTGILAEFVEFPKPSQIRQIVRDMQTPEWSPSSGGKCPYCSPPGFVRCAVTREWNGKPTTYWGMKLCVCHAGHGRKEESE